LAQQNQVTINGEKRVFDSRATLHEVVTALGLEPERVAVELNRAIVKRELWQTTTFDSDAEIEIVQFVGGG
jgi:thiamine biosynthesis protein ThiS